MVETSPQTLLDTAAKKPPTIRPRIRIALILTAAFLLPVVALFAWCGSFDRAKRFLGGERLFVEKEADTLKTDGDTPTLIRRIRVKNTAFETVSIVGCTHT